MVFTPKKVPHIFILLSEFIVELILDLVEKLSYNKKTSIPIISKIINFILNLPTINDIRPVLNHFSSLI